MLKCKGLIILLTVCHVIMLVWRILLVMFSQQGGHSQEDYEDHDILEYKPQGKKR